jgi:hypothetical protein
MSVFFDAHWWWRAEFGGRSNPYLESDSNQTAALLRPEAAGAAAPLAAVANQTVDDRVNAAVTDSRILDVGSSDAVLPIFLSDSDWNELGELGFDWF